MEPAKQVRKAVGAQVFRLRHSEQLDEKSRKLDDVIVSAPRMPVARTDGEAEPTIEPGRPLEIAHRMDDMVKTARHRSCLHFTAENAVGCRNMFVIEATIGPSRSLSDRLDSHSGSVANLFHLVSRSARDSQASK